MSECDLDPPCTSVEKDMQKTIDMHADRVMQLTEILTAALPALRHCYKQATWLPQPFKRGNGLTNKDDMRQIGLSECICEQVTTR